MNGDNDNLIGEASSFLEVLDQVSQLAPINKSVLVVGERGTGKELIAARLHYLSSRWEQPYIKLNCASINENLLETELFGHEVGAFTGASKKHMGRFELADNGTLFLDELGNSSLAVQEKLLRVIEYGEFERVGGSKTIKVNVRLIAATNENLPKLAKEGKFRADLLDRLAFDVVTIPPLRARLADIMILSQHFALSMTKELERDYFAGFSKNAEFQLLNYAWPGNVRELKNVIERNIYKSSPQELINNIQFDPFESPFQPEGEACFQLKSATTAIDTASTDNPSPSNEIQNDSFTEQPNANMQTNTFPIDFKQSIIDKEINLITLALEHSHFNQKKCADLLGMTYHQLRGYLKKYQLLDQK